MHSICCYLCNWCYNSRGISIPLVHIHLSMSIEIAICVFNDPSIVQYLGIERESPLTLCFPHSATGSVEIVQWLHEIVEMLMAAVIEPLVHSCLQHCMSSRDLDNTRETIDFPYIRSDDPNWLGAPISFGRVSRWDSWGHSSTSFTSWRFAFDEEIFESWGFPLCAYLTGCFSLVHSHLNSLRALVFLIIAF